MKTTIVDGFYCHVENGGLSVDLEKEDKSDYLVLRASWNQFGNAGPEAAIPLLSENQIDAMIRLLTKAKAMAKNLIPYDLGKAEFQSDADLERMLK